MPRKNPQIDQSENQDNNTQRKFERAKRIEKKLHRKRRRWDPFDDQNGKESTYLRKG